MNTNFTQLPDAIIQYMVRFGDTPNSISQRFNTTVPLIISVNPRLNINWLRAGQIINIPIKMPKKEFIPGTLSYKIQNGDTLDSIASRFRTSIDTIRNANQGIDVSNLKTVQRINIPAFQISDYFDEKTNLSFKYPANWVRSSMNRAEGKDGFFEINFVSSNLSVEEFTRYLVLNNPTLYGSEPIVKKIRPKENDIFTIIPSKEHPNGAKKQCAIVIPNNRHMKSSSKEDNQYEHIVLKTTTDFIEQIILSIDFLAVGTSG